MKAVEVTELPRTDPPLLAAAAYLAVLAYPDDADERDALIEATRAYCAKGAYHYLGRRDLPKKLLELPTRDMRRRLTRAQNIIWFERFPALEAANELIMVRTTKGSNLRISGEDKVLNVCRKWAPISKQKPHFYQRAWLPSLQILHLIQPFYRYWVDELNGERIGLARYVSRNPTWVIKAIESASRLRLVYVRLGIIKKSEGKLAKLPQIDLRLSPETYPVCQFW